MSAGDREAVIALIAQHRRHVEKSPGVGDAVQRYALACYDELAEDIQRRARAAPAEELAQLRQKYDALYGRVDYLLKVAVTSDEGIFTFPDGETWPCGVAPRPGGEPSRNMTAEERETYAAFRRARYRPGGEARETEHFDVRVGESIWGKHGVLPEMSSARLTPGAMVRVSVSPAAPEGREAICPCGRGPRATLHDGVSRWWLAETCEECRGEATTNLLPTNPELVVEPNVDLVENWVRRLRAGSAEVTEAADKVWRSMGHTMEINGLIIAVAESAVPLFAEALEVGQAQGKAQCCGIPEGYGKSAPPPATGAE